MKLYIGMRLRPLMFLLFREKQHESNSLFLVVLGNVHQLHLMVTSIYGFSLSSQLQDVKLCRIFSKLCRLTHTHIYNYIYIYIYIYIRDWRFTV